MPLLIRIVRLTLQPEKVAEFLANFEANKAAIRSQPGCQRLELLRDYELENVYLTYSYWEHPDDLENYRQSELFKGIWARTKPLFADKPIAWSVRREVVLD